MISTNGINSDKFRSTKYITDNIDKLKFDFHIFLKKEDNANSITS